MPSDGPGALRLAEITKLVGALRGVLVELVAAPGDADVLRELCEVGLQNARLKPEDIKSSFLTPFGAGTKKTAAKKKA